MGHGVHLFQVLYFYHTVQVLSASIPIPSAELRIKSQPPVSVVKLTGPADKIKNNGVYLMFD